MRKEKPSSPKTRVRISKHRCHRWADTVHHSRQHQQLMSWNHWIISSMIVCLLLSVPVRAEDFGKAFSHTSNAAGGDETYIIIAFSAFLAFCILSVVATIGYFSILEDRLMKRYLEEGIAVEANVVSAEFARGGHAQQWGFARSDRMETEYVLFVEYSQPIAEGTYMTRIRKQIKAKEADIIRPSYYTYSVDGHEESVHLDAPIQVQKMIQMLHDSENGTHQSVGKIEMLVLPDFYKSGISRAQVERSNTYHNRLSMIALIFSGVGLAVFCVRLAAKAISNSEYGGKTDDTNTVTLYMIGIFLVLLILEILLVHCCLKKAFVDALEDEYLKSGDLVPTEEEDDSSISTGSDFFLRGAGASFGQENTKFTGLPSHAMMNHYVGPTSSTCPIPSSVHL